MKKTLALLSLAAVCSMGTAIAQDHHSNQNQIKRVLLISVDGMHAVDFLNCANGISTINNGKPYCPAMAALATTGVNYVAASTSKPSDSFPGLTAIVTGGSPALTGVYYDVAYSRNYSAPAKTTGNGVAAGPCTPGGAPTGTTTEYEEGIDGCVQEGLIARERLIHTPAETTCPGVPTAISRCARRRRK